MHIFQVMNKVKRRLPMSFSTSKVKANYSYNTGMQIQYKHGNYCSQFNQYDCIRVNFVLKTFNNDSWSADPS